MDSRIGRVIGDLPHHARGGHAAHAAEAREVAPLVLVNLIPMTSSHGIWWTTRGNHLLGVPDLAYWDAGGRQQAGAVQQLISAVSASLRAGRRLMPGDTVSLGGRTLRVGTVTEPAEANPGPGATLTLQDDGGQPAAIGCGLLAVLAGGALVALPSLTSLAHGWRIAAWSAGGLLLLPGALMAIGAWRRRRG